MKSHKRNHPRKRKGKVIPFEGISRREPSSAEEIREAMEEVQGNIRNRPSLDRLQDEMARWKPGTGEEIELWNTAHNLLLMGWITEKAHTLLHDHGEELEQSIRELHQQLQEVFLCNAITRKAFLDTEIRLKSTLQRAKSKTGNKSTQTLIDQMIELVDERAA
jgi:hypothetical protein